MNGKRRTENGRPSASLFALIDCNNFFVSCERLFRPDLEGKPVVVLSSNDGCAVARSNEVKALGVPMGAPAFKYRELFESHGVEKFSANFDLYGNIARRVTNILYELTPRTEVYSIDEAFLDISQLPIDDLSAWGRAAQARIQRETGIPVSVGIAPTKTLAKLASEHAKQTPELDGVLTITEDNRERYLATTAITDVWGIGWRLAPRLRAEGIATVLGVAEMRPRHAQQIMGVHGRQLVAELNGTRCLQLTPIGRLRKSVMRGRTFGEDTNQSYVVESAIATLTAQAAFRLRQDDQAARRVGLLIENNKHKPGHRRWYRELTFPTPEADTGRIISALQAEFTAVYSTRQYYHRVNIFLMDFAPGSRLQTDVFGATDPGTHDRSRARMQAVDAINNRFGRGHIKFATEDISQSWRPRRRQSSPRYVTDWSELPVAEIT